MKPPFECSPWNNPFNTDGWVIFRVGACHGQWRAVTGAYEILGILNDNIGNGDFAHAIDFFEISCKRDKYNLRIREVWNERLRVHLVEKRGFVLEGKDDYIKLFNQ